MGDENKHSLVALLIVLTYIVHKQTALLTHGPFDQKILDTIKYQVRKPMCGKNIKVALLGKWGILKLLTFCQGFLDLIIKVNS